VNFDSARQNCILFSVDENYLWPFMVSLYSAKKGAKNKDFASVFAYNPLDFSEEQIASVEWAARWLEIDLTLKELPQIEEIETINHVSKASYNKFLAISQMQSDYVWFDSDTLMLAGWDEIFELFDTHEGTIALKAVYEPTNTLHVTSNNFARKKAGLKYFNSGVMIIYPGNWTRLGFDLNWLEIAGRRTLLGFEFNDQDVFNYLTVGHTESLPSQFNYFAKSLGLFEKCRSPEKKIVHFVGPQKPWHFSEIEKFFYRRLCDLAREFSLELPEVSIFDLDSHNEYWTCQDKLIELFKEEGGPHSKLLLSSRKKSLVSILDWKAKLKAYLLFLLFKSVLKPRSKKTRS